jgi:hypothetical protein
MAHSEHAPDPERVRISLRLKAGRYLAGYADGDGKPTALSVEELAQHPLLVANRITRNRLEEVEQTKTAARPMELEKIAVALGLGDDWFAAEPSLVSQLDDAERVLREAVQVARELRQAQEAAAAAAGGPGHRKPGGAGDAA